MEDGPEMKVAGLGSFESKASLEEMSHYTRLGSSFEQNVSSSVGVCGVSQPSNVIT